MGNTVCFTGHRPQNLPWGFDEGHPTCIEVRMLLVRVIRYLIENKKATHFLTGMALGTDMWAAENVIELKDEYPEITLEAVIPCSTQADVWKTSARIRYNEILSQCDKVTVLQKEYTPGCMKRRNEYMVNLSRYIVAVWNGKSGGTGNTVKYAFEKRKTIYYISSEDLKVRCSE